MKNKTILLSMGLIMMAGVSCSTGTKRSAPSGEERTLIIVEKGASSAGFYTGEGRRIKSIKLDTFPHEMRFSADRKRAYITNNGSLRYMDTVSGGETISVINLEKMEKEADIMLTPWRRPHGIDIDPETGYLAVSVENPDQVLLIDPSEGKIIKHFDSHGKTPHMVTISKGAEWLYVMNVYSNNLAGIHTSSGESFVIPVGSRPQEGVLTADEKIIFVGCDDYISVIDLEQRQEIARIPNGANRMELVREGALLVLSSNRHGIGFADARTYEMIHHIDIPYKPFSIHVSEDERFAYVAAEEQDIVYTVDIDKMKIIREFKTPPGSRPDPVMDFRKVLPGKAGKEQPCHAMPSFRREEIDSQFQKAYQVKAVDLNGDMLQDLVAVSDRLPEIVWYENPGWEKHVITRETWRNIDVDFYDIDMDGDLDMALACRFDSRNSETGGYLYWLEHPDNDITDQWKLTWIDSIPTSHRIRWADLDGDGRKELVNLPLLGTGATEPDYAIPLELVCYTIPEDPSRDPWEKTVIDNSLHLAHGLHITRWDDDTRMDILTASSDGINLYRSAGKPGRPSWEKTHLCNGRPGSGPEAGCSEVCPGKMEGKENAFIATIDPWHGNEVSVYTRTGPAQWKRQVIDTTFVDGHAVFCTDFDYDGTDEIIAGHRGSGYNLYIYRYDPNENQWERHDLDLGGISAAGIAVLDADLDGLKDIAACGSQTENVVIYHAFHP